MQDDDDFKTGARSESRALSFSDSYQSSLWTVPKEHRTLLLCRLDPPGPAEPLDRGPGPWESAMNVTLRKAALFFKWGRVPKAWELSFIDRMRGLEEKGLDFNEVLRAVLPELYGEDTSVVMRTWVGRKARCDPERFARTISEMFGASAHSVLGSIDKLADEASLLQRKAPKEPLIQSLMDAIQRIDAAKTAAQPDEPQGRP